MMITIAKTEVDAMKYVCALLEYKVDFYSVETNTDLLQAEVLDSFGEEPSNIMMWHMGRQIELRLLVESFSARPKI